MSLHCEEVYNYIMSAGLPLFTYLLTLSKNSDRLVRHDSPCRSQFGFSSTRLVLQYVLYDSCFDNAISRRDVRLTENSSNVDPSSPCTNTFAADGKTDSIRRFQFQIDDFAAAHKSRKNYSSLFAFLFSPPTLNACLRLRFGSNVNHKGCNWVASDSLQWRLRDLVKSSQRQAVSVFPWELSWHVACRGCYAGERKTKKVIKKNQENAGHGHLRG